MQEMTVVRLFAAGHKVTPQISGVRLILAGLEGERRSFVEASAEAALNKGENPLKAAEAALDWLHIRATAESEVGPEARPHFLDNAAITAGSVEERIKAGHEAVKALVDKKKAAYKAAKKLRGSYAAA